MQKFDRKFITAQFTRTMEKLGLPVGTKPGEYDLDYYRYGGGYTIVRYSNDLGGISTPFGGMRYEGKTFSVLLQGIFFTAVVMQEESK